MNAHTFSDRLITRRLRALADTLPAAFDGDASSVHKARVASRRVREALPVVLAQAPTKKARKLRRAFQQVTRALGPVRETDVTLARLHDLMEAHPESVDALEHVRRDLETERHQRREHMLGALESMDFESLVDRIDTVMHAGPPDPEDTRALDSGVAAALAVRVARRVRKLRRSVEAAGPLYAPEPLHAVRIAVKKLRYALELAYELRLLTSRRTITHLKTVQDTLGRMHDDEMLGARLARTQAVLAAPDSDLVGRLSSMTRLLEDRCRDEHARYIAQRDRLVARAEGALGLLTSGTSEPARFEAADVTVH